MYRTVLKETCLVLQRARDKKDIVDIVSHWPSS